MHAECSELVCAAVCLVSAFHFSDFGCGSPSWGVQHPVCAVRYYDKSATTFCFGAYSISVFPRDSLRNHCFFKKKSYLAGLLRTFFNFSTGNIFNVSGVIRHQDHGLQWNVCPYSDLHYSLLFINPLRRHGSFILVLCRYEVQSDAPDRSCNFPCLPSHDRCLFCLICLKMLPQLHR
jgi:hypothetical protein